MSEKDRPVSDEEWAAFVEAAKQDGISTGGGTRWTARGRKTRPARPDPLREGEQERERGRKRGAVLELPGWRTGPAWQERDGRRNRRRQVKGVAGFAVALAVLLVALRPELVTDHLPEGLGGPGDTTPLAAESTRPTAAPSEETFPDEPTPREPFRGSPALRWADGAAGIETPRAEAMGWMSKDEVAAALSAAKEFLVAANLDPVVVDGGRPTAALALLDPLQPDVRSGMEKGLTRATEKNDPTLLFSRFSPAEAKLVGSVVKTRGRMTLEAGKGADANRVLIHTDYTFVYPVVKVRPGADEVARTIARREITFALPDPAVYRVTKGKLSVSSMSSSVGNSDCDGPTDGFFHPLFREDLQASPGSGSGPATDPYDRSKGLGDLPKECGRLTRS
ncbi:hypothetical protein ACF09C_32240 [Streptomyces sp. NPDC014870]|uniref:hypothetical protein n=1 Tax=Streptomyces sp. NPDC014870 TaxID=3364925 RepID=UPI0036FC75D9